LAWFATTTRRALRFHLNPPATNMLPDELWMTALDEQYPCRELQFRQLAALYNVCDRQPAARSRAR